MSKQKEIDKQDAIRFLKKQMKIKPGERIYVKLNHVSKSGMKRVLDLYVIRKNELNRITWHVAKLLDWTYDRNKEGITVGGCGMDMGFHTVYCMGYALWPKGTPKPHGTRNGEPDSDGGYALKSVWM